jgi:hypothetical protein
MAVGVKQDVNLPQSEAGAHPGACERWQPATQSSRAGPLPILPFFYSFILPFCHSGKLNWSVRAR